MNIDGERVGASAGGSIAQPARTVLIVANNSSEGSAPLTIDIYGWRMWTTASGGSPRGP